ncbi:poly(rC)-binding protein 3/4 [Marchantia polymorpha subsp. ruderalis]|uniref:K Homology domain-containing protein n=2 Tax=Marchantia polymorpha TaxID=3197 RepID=A0AAF6C0R5_MARPO|nr:hypothetical protein MARPO_0051s0075 [Marchantia polymorpha]BBN17849.1 hypothetical protein Mp_7g17380 [Marchantia polymorpha subsp. ruderalis]|eukprot:PTQ38474.1 hypothetical protein MARPO_0051s0075 [Marchantia polymorpha]
MAAVTVASHSEQPESPGLSRVTPDHRTPTAATQKRGRDDDAGSGGEKKWAGWPGDNVFRLVVPVQKVGGIIGRKGEFVKKMCEETRARIKILEGVPGTSERIVLVSAREDPDLAVSPAMDGLLRVHRRVVEGSDPEGEDGHSEPRAGGGTIASRLLVAATQAGSLIGRQGATIKSIQDASGATVRVLPPEELPLCALSDDRVVEIQGEARNVHRAMELVVSHLRKFLVDRSVLALFELNRAVTANQSQQQPSAGSWAGHSPANALPSNAGGPGPMGNSSHYGGASVPNDNLNYYQSPPEIHHHDTHHHHHGVSLYGRDPSIGSLTSSVSAPPPAPVITQADFVQMTQHMQIPLSYADAIIGAAGANISYMRRNSGATITIQETRGVPGEMTVEIHGSAAQVQTAQQLIQNFMAGATGAPASTYNSVDTSYSSYANQNSLYSSAPSNSGHATTAAFTTHFNSNTYGGY